MKQIFIFSDSQKDNISYFEREPAILVSMSRSDLPYLKEQDFASFTAVYVLIGGNKRYVGQAAGQTIYQRLYQHFSKEDKNWFESVLFFSRTDGKLSKADTDYLEKRLIQDFTDKSNYQMMNSTIGNKSYIGKLSKAQSDQLYETVFEIIDDIANIDLFGVSEGESIDEASSSNTFEIQYDGHTLRSKSARGVFVDFVKSMLEDQKNKQLIDELIAPDAPTAGVILGRKISTYNGRPNSAEVAPGIWLYTNFSRKDTKNKLEKLAKQLGISARIKWK
ncbi:GIY-YIG nuclease family protein [Listeria monocytogenes]|uniref:GIY-YIG nuclease family protein n=2 Tax=Listeria monocytogenes TaxID=1639 RepID=A0A475SWJ2_LISMN|nr:GIY-YIG nuclease family protein [Listeria monocytogenes]EAE3706315.1 GIY-YIG nuclease family protein [Listeria monocytogenes serotype 1/2b]ANE39644.1 excinuclease ABC subunit A [Listeria monocytogenes]AQP80054.1 excinuclease ABC subunit A [Listeria monocytogenes]EAC2470268.1 GIY-YIG nuclease family protein [Listeria monocytogenes]EAC2961653.1 GIY-YIG nuclease family protein [Listeria monocytogenes]